MARHQVRNAFMPPTALKLMREVERPAQRFGYHMRSIASGGEALGTETLEWGRATFGLTINEFWDRPKPTCSLATALPLCRSNPGRWVDQHRDMTCR